MFGCLQTTSCEPITVSGPFPAASPTASPTSTPIIVPTSACLVTAGLNIGKTVCRIPCPNGYTPSADCNCCVAIASAPGYTYDGKLSNQYYCVNPSGVAGIQNGPGAGTQVVCASNQVSCLATVGTNVGQTVCAPKCTASQQPSADCTSCVDIVTTTPSLPCASNQVSCFVTAGTNVGKTVCAPKCTSSQQPSADCSNCIDIYSAPSSSPIKSGVSPSTASDNKAKGPTPTPKGPSKVPTKGKGKAVPKGGKEQKVTSPPKDKSKGGHRRSLRQAVVDMMIL